MPGCSSAAVADVVLCCAAVELVVEQMTSETMRLAFCGCLFSPHFFIFPLSCGCMFWLLKQLSDKSTMHITHGRIIYTA